MPGYPPTIIALDYATPPPPPLLGSVMPCDEECSLEALCLDAAERNIHGTDFNANHGNLLAAAAGRYALAPGEDALHINYRFVGETHIRSARLDLYDRATGAMRRIWTKTLEWDGNGSPPIGSTPFSGRLDDNDAERVASDAVRVTIIDYDIADFPTHHLNVQNAPYKLEMTIVTVEGASIRTAKRWIYLDVELADLTLELGPERILPKLAPNGVAVHPAIGFDERNSALRLAMETALGDTNMTAGAHAHIDVPLDGTVFGADSGEWPNNTFADAWQARFRDGPYVPLICCARVRSHAGNPVRARQALGGARFLWDWKGADLDLTNVHPRSRGAIRGAYFVGLRTWPTGKQNTPVSFASNIGGKRGGGALLFKHRDDGHTRYVNAGAREFPFEMVACGARHGAIWSRARTDDVDYGSYTGAVFTPSIIAQDRFTLTVYFAYGAAALWDIDTTAEHLAAHLPFDVPFVTSGEMKIKRVVKVARWWRHNGNVTSGTFTWAGVAGDFQQAGIDLDTIAARNPRDINPIRFRAIFDQVLLAMPAARRGVLAPRAEQANSAHGYGIKTAEFAAFRTSVQDRFTARFRQLQALNRVAANQAHVATYDRLQARADVYLELIGDADAAARLNDSIVEVCMPKVFPTVGDLTAWLDPIFSNFIPDVPAGRAAQAVALILNRPADVGDRSAVDQLRDLAGFTSAAHGELSLEVAHVALSRICGVLSEQDAPDLDGMQVFQFDFENNHDQFSNSGEAFDTPSNRTTCPECHHALNADDRAARRCPNGACAARLRSSASIMTLVPWRHMAGFRLGVFASLQDNKAKYWVLTNMAGTRPEILVTHEMGHHLFLPHSPHGFNFPDPVPSSLFWRLLSAAVKKNAGVRAQLIGGSVPGGYVEALHAADHTSCIMGYNFAEMANLHFCAKCALRLRGWSNDYIVTL